MIKNFPVFHRFKVASFIYAMSRALMYIGTSFGLVYLTEWFGHWGILILAYPTIFGILWSVQHFEKIERLRLAGTSSKSSDGISYEQVA
ncbi:hypothetical protein [Candidatus Finniella inopinata]|uniref:hypothetical protein n=1 Tax=Candidatus Finniella inopinata TaxID=1696036 RepID=UPI001A9334A0|nr:hypothetical protein [Candidatus Finniella inopinata]